MSLKIEYLENEEAVYDISVEDNHNFFANDILVHNCTEITLHSSKDYTFSCVLSSMNASLYDEWKDTDAVFNATVFLDCVNQDLIEIGKTQPGMEKVVAFAEASRALGLGMLGFHTYLQDHGIPFESMDAYYKNTEIFKHLDEESLRASKWMAENWGEPEWCKGYGVRNTHRVAIAPNLCVTADTKLILANSEIISYDELVTQMGIDYDSLLEYEILLDNGTIKTLKYDDNIEIIRKSEHITIKVYQLKAHDELI
jgi:hypothetical protein